MTTHHGDGESFLLPSGLTMTCWPILRGFAWRGTTDSKWREGQSRTKYGWHAQRRLRAVFDALEPETIWGYFPTGMAAVDHCTNGWLVSRRGPDEQFYPTGSDGAELFEGWFDNPQGSADELAEIVMSLLGPDDKSNRSRGAVELPQVQRRRLSISPIGPARHERLKAHKGEGSTKADPLRLADEIDAGDPDGGD